MQKNINSLGKCGQYCLSIIFSFLEKNEKVNLGLLNKQLRLLILRNQVWGIFDLTDIGINHWKSYITWVEKYLPIINPHSLNIHISEDCYFQDVLKICQINMLFVEQLTIYCQSEQVHSALADSCSQCCSLTIRSSIFTDQMLQLMSKKMKKIKQLKIHKDDINFTCQNLSLCLNSSIQRLDLKCHLVNLDQVRKVCELSQETLTEIQLDIQEFQQQSLIKILGNLKNVQKLRLYHCDNLTNQKQLSSVLPQKLKQICISKARNFTMHHIITHHSSLHLINIDFSQCQSLADKDLIYLSVNAPNLQKCNLSWCFNLSYLGLKPLIKNCKMIEILKITGIKEINDNLFQQYVPFLQSFNKTLFFEVKEMIRKNQKVQTQSSQFFQKNAYQQFLKIKTFQRLKILNCNKCNGISDEILTIIYLRWRKVTTVNYFSNRMGLYFTDDFDYY